MISSYFLEREQLMGAFVLIDVRHPPQKIDVDFMYWLGSKAIPFSIIFTKADKLKPKVLDRHITHYQNVLKKTWDPLPNHFLSSSVKKTGKTAILNYIDTINEQLKRD